MKGFPGHRRAAIVAFDPACAVFADATPEPLRRAEAAWLVVDAAARPRVADVLADAFFDDFDCRSAHARPPEPLGRTGRGLRRPGGRADDAADPRWAQRQYSVIWAPVDAAAVGGGTVVAMDVDDDAAVRAWLDDDAVPPADNDDVAAPFWTDAARP